MNSILQNVSQETFYRRVGVFMELYDWLFIILLILIGYSAYKHIKWMYPSNKLLLKVKRVSVNGLLVLWLCLLMFFTWDVFQEIIDAYQSEYSNSMSRPLFDRIDVNIIWIIISLMHIIRQYKSREIRENGITTPEGFIGWKDIRAYKWISGGESLLKRQDEEGNETASWEEVEFTVNRDGLFSNEEIKIVWKVKPEQKEAVEKILSSYVKESTF